MSIAGPHTQYFLSGAKSAPGMVTCASFFFLERTDGHEDDYKNSFDTNIATVNKIIVKAERRNLFTMSRTKKGQAQAQALPLPNPKSSTALPNKSNSTNRRRHSKGRSFPDQVQNPPCVVCSQNPPCAHVPCEMRPLREGEVHPCHIAPTKSPPWAGFAARSPSHHSRLHKELIDFAAWVSLRESEPEARRESLQRVEETTCALWPGSTCELFGSSATGIEWFGSDLDVCVVMPTADCGSASSCLELADELHSQEHVKWLEARMAAVVPIVTYEDGWTGVHLDVGFEKGLQGTNKVTELVAGFKEADCDVFKTLMLPLKVLLNQKGLDKPFYGGLGSFKLGVLVAHYITTANSTSELGELFKGFLRFCVSEFDFEAGIELISGHVVTFGGTPELLRQALGRVLVECSGSGASSVLSRSIAVSVLDQARQNSLDLAQQSFEQTGGLLEDFSWPGLCADAESWPGLGADEESSKSLSLPQSQSPKQLSPAKPNPWSGSKIGGFSVTKQTSGVSQWNYKEAVSIPCFDFKKTPAGIACA